MFNNLTKNWDWDNNTCKVPANKKRNFSAMNKFIRNTTNNSSIKNQQNEKQRVPCFKLSNHTEEDDRGSNLITIIQKANQAVNIVIN